MADSTPTRIPGFYQRTYRAAGNIDELQCLECNWTAALEHGLVPAAGELLACSSCGLSSRVPALPSQAGMAEPIDPPPHDERS